MEQFVFQCPYCNETIDISQLPVATFPICCSAFPDSDSDIVMCPNCKTLYHSECWEENHGCSTYGCASTKHLETHNAADDNVESGMVNCPFCGASHASTDLVCPSCGHLLQDNAGGNDDMFESVRKSAKTGLPKLGRNFKLLWEDIKTVLLLAWRAMAHYADFKGRSTRGEYWAYVLVYYTLTMFLLLFQAQVLFWIVVFACLVPSIAITVRRLRDTALSPWMIFAIPILPLLVLVPTVHDESNKEML